MHFFTDLYKDELVYSSIARLGYYARINSSKEVLEEVFNDPNSIPSLNIGSHIDALVANIEGSYTVEQLIYNHTIYPYYEAFLPVKRQKRILHIIKSKNGRGLYAMLGAVAGGICRKQSIYYCPKCIEVDEATYGECYIHREHQLEGVLVCPHHGVYLRRYKIDRSNSSRIEFIRLNSKDIEKEEVRQVDDANIRKILIKLSRMAYKLLIIHKSIGQQEVLKKYKELLVQKGLVNISGRIKQNELYEAFKSFYDKKVLRLLESDIDNDYEYNWLRVITRNSKRTVHPIRHLLFMNFLGVNVEEFFASDVADYKPFGEGPWPCLNPVADHYKQDIIADVSLTMDYKTKKPVATFSCSCGFVYSRMGPDKDISDRYRIGRKKQFGHVWEARLKTYLQEGTYSLRKVARMMECDPKTILKFDRKWKINCFSKTDVEIDESKNDTVKKLSLAAQDNVVSEVQLEQNKKRIEIGKKEIVHKEKVDWAARDEVLALDFKQAYIELRSLDKPVRITRTRLAKKLRLEGSIEKIINKLPLTKAYIGTVVESVRAFQLRRCKWIIDRLIENDERVVMWKIQRMAGIRRLAFNEISAEIEEYINYKLSP